MVRRVVDTDFWTDMNVIDHYSPEDKYFYLYLITNGKSSQVGIYSLPIKVISFETGYSSEAVQVLLDRFITKYNQIIYSKKTQEVAIINSLKFSILKGGKPVKDLLEKELGLVKDASLIQATHQNMLQFWNLSKRPFDLTIKETFENELCSRGLMTNHDQPIKDTKDYINNDNNNVIKNGIKNDIDNVIHNHKNNDNDNEESETTNRKEILKDEIVPEEFINESGTTNRDNPDEMKVFEHFTNIILKLNPDLHGEINPSNIVKFYYQELYGEVHSYIETQLKSWQKLLPTSLVLEALSRSGKAAHTLPYANSIIKNWASLGINSHEELLKRDAEFKK